MYSRDHHNIIKQLSSNLKKILNQQPNPLPKKPEKEQNKTHGKQERYKRLDWK